MARRRSLTALQRLGLWACTFAGGAVAGSGVFLLVQVRLIRYLQQQIAEIGAFERFLGRMTFLWRDLDEKIALAVADIPNDYLEHSENAAHWLMGVGFAGVALILPWYLRRRWDS
jgi:hypothetical protein